jgi:hypothetical protein
MSKFEVYRIFNEIQSRTNTNANAESFFKIFEKTEPDVFNSYLEKIFLMIFKSYKERSAALKNIKDFLRMFIEMMVRRSKTPRIQQFFKFLCTFFTQECIKKRDNKLCVYFLSKNFI